MKPYILVKGSDSNVEDFEVKISEALEQGYELSGDLVTQVIPKGTGQHEVLFMQALINEDCLEFEDDDEDEMEYDDEIILSEEA